MKEKVGIPALLGKKEVTLHFYFINDRFGGVIANRFSI